MLIPVYPEGGTYTLHNATARVVSIMLTSRVLDGWWRARARVPRATRWKLIGSLLEKASPPSGTTSRLVATDPSPAAVLDTKALPQFPVFPLERHSETAIWMDGRQLTFGALSARSLALATIFAAGNGGNLALPKGATVGVIVETELEVPELFMACRTAGLKILPIPDVLHPTEVENTLQNMKLDALFCTSRYYGSVLARQVRIAPQDTARSSCIHVPTCPVFQRFPF